MLQDGREYIIEVNDSALSLMGESQEEDRRHIAELVLSRMNQMCKPFTGEKNTGGIGVAPLMPGGGAGQPGGTAGTRYRRTSGSDTSQFEDGNANSSSPSISRRESQGEGLSLGQLAVLNLIRPS